MLIPGGVIFYLVLLTVAALSGLYVGVYRRAFRLSRRGVKDPSLNRIAYTCTATSFFAAIILLLGAGELLRHFYPQAAPGILRLSGNWSGIGLLVSVFLLKANNSRQKNIVLQYACGPLVLLLMLLSGLYAGAIIRGNRNGGKPFDPPPPEKPKTEKPVRIRALPINF